MSAQKYSLELISQDILYCKVSQWGPTTKPQPRMTGCAAECAYTNINVLSRIQTCDQNSKTQFSATGLAQGDCLIKRFEQLCLKTK